jgi:adenylate cyclase class 2
MQTEIEAKFLNVDHDTLRTTLKALGANLMQPMRSMRRTAFDFPDHRLRREKGGWARVRDEGDKVTMSYKQTKSRTLHGTSEVELVVDDYETARNFLEAIGMKPVSIQESKRETWELDGVHIDLDEWPWARPFVEIEAGSEAEVWRIAQQLNLERDAAKHGSVEPVYMAEYEVTEAEINGWPEIRFGDVPTWLEHKR